MGKFSKIKEALKSVLAQFAVVSTDKGALYWDGEEDLKAGDAVYVDNENDERVVAEDGDYKTEDGKTIVVAEGKVSEIKDPEAEVEDAPVEEEQNYRKVRFEKVRAAFEESYEEKERKIMTAIGNAGYYCWLVEAGDDYAIVEAWDEMSGDYKYYRFAISWEGEEPVIGEYVEVEYTFVPVKDEAAVEETVEEMAAVEEQVEEPVVEPVEETVEEPVVEEPKQKEETIKELKARIEELEKQPAEVDVKTKFRTLKDVQRTDDERFATLSRKLKALK